jgi:hypothetical protein
MDTSTAFETARTAEADRCPQDAVIVAVPMECVIASPDELTLAMPGLLEVHTAE